MGRHTVCIFDMGILNNDTVGSIRVPAIRVGNFDIVGGLFLVRYSNQQNSIFRILPLRSSACC